MERKEVAGDVVAVVVDNVDVDDAEDGDGGADVDDDASGAYGAVTLGAGAEYFAECC